MILSETEYLEIERRAEFKSEYFGGEMFAMAGGSLRHSLIGTNLAREFGNRLKGHRCKAFNADLRIQIERTGLYTYPDFSVICDQPIFLDSAQDTVVNPVVLIEVLSDSTEAYDRGKKFEHYRQIRSLREYLLVSQQEPRVEQFIKQDDGSWLWRESTGVEAFMAIASLGIDVSLGEMFAGVEFGPVALRHAAPRGPGE